jgi:hypothetical protein
MTLRFNRSVAKLDALDVGTCAVGLERFIERAFCVRV